jgi:Na+/proline symporter
LFNVIAGVPVTFGAIFMAFIVWFYGCTGGLKASTWVGVIQFVLLVGGIVILGFFCLTSFGGWTGFSAQIAALEPKLLTVPKVINFGMGGGWTAVMILTYMFALMGIQSSPAFTMWTFGIANPKPLAWQQAFMSTFVVGFALFYFTAFQGMGAKVLQVAGNAAFADVNQATVVPTLMKEFLPPFMLGLVFMGAIAAIHSTAAPYIGTGGSIIMRDVYVKYIKKGDCSHSEQIWADRVFKTLLTVAALWVGLTSTAALVILGALATAFGFVMYVMLMGVIWGFRFPSIGATLGVLVGMLAVFLTYKIWPSPLSMHCAFWGTFSGLVVAYLCRALGIKDTEETIKRQAEVRQYLDSVDEPSESGKKWRGIMKIATPAWYFFAIGPACILGNSAFSFAGFPPLWSWQIAWWIIGIVMMWALCFKAEMSTTTEKQIERANKETMLVIKEI